MHARGLFAVLVIALVGAGCVPEMEGTGGETTSPLTVDHATVDAGAVIKGEHIRRTFTLGNAGPKAVIIDSTETTCSGIVKLSNQRVGTGGRATVEVDFDTRTLKGGSPIDLATIVHFSDPFPGELRLTVHATVRDEFDLAPPIVDFGYKNNPLASERTVRLMVKDARRLRALSARSTDDAVAVELRDGQGLLPEAEYLVVVRERPDAPIGSHFGNVVIRTNSPINPEIRIPVLGTISSDSADRSAPGAR